LAALRISGQTGIRMAMVPRMAERSNRRIRSRAADAQ